MNKKPYRKKEKYFIGVDLGGTEIKAGLTDYQGKVVKSIKKPTGKSKKQLLNNLSETIQRLDSPRVIAVGIGLPGKINREKGILVYGPNLPFVKNLSLISFLNKRFKKQFFLENDANCFTLAEAILGQGKNFNYVLGITIGTGIGGGIVVDKKLYRGIDGTAGEFGHMIVADSHLFKCSCGQWDHLESLAAGPAMTKWYKKFTRKKKTTFEIVAEGLKNKKQAKKVLLTMADYLSNGILNLINVFDPEIIVIGGGLSKIDLFIKITLKEVERKRIPLLNQRTKIKKSKLDNQAGIVGAALIAKNSLNN